MRNLTLSIVIPALNQASQISEVVGGILPLARMYLGDFEIILVDDASTDDTGAIMDRFALRDPKVRVIHNSHVMGEAFAFKAGLGMASFDAITLIPGDGTFRNESIGRMFRAAGVSDLVVTYRDNRSDVGFHLAVLSHLARFALNAIFGFSLADYHSLIIYPVAPLRDLPFKNPRRDHQIYALISLLRLGLTYVQVPVSLDTAAKGTSRKPRPRNHLDLIKNVLSLLFTE
ncbi:MAG: glycosyltransferase family 2 protein [Bradyrhizobium sp.]|uniref:glycosyltransferase family 2 protein n=1 Tax=Bradyrhizobium sp. TaxID=376 RepID=UPI001C2A4350|nr:glycosyltransferase family 2 protein [Bradyrhizobium sp.]MBU6461209.1 glycosyltransferase family 2 protein [Pseudomonadota bacterium]MDE2066286.1 glycosyltransferase family 2 protein [Bradyrhizobium sp.]